MAERHSKRDERQTSECPDATYTSFNGLKFDTHCHLGFEGNQTVIDRYVTGSIEECMYACSGVRPRCYGITYHLTDRICSLLLNPGLAIENLIQDQTFNVAVAQKSQLISPEDTECPYPDTSSQTTGSGEDFTVLCDKDFGGFGDYCRYGSGDLGCAPHADSLDECMDICLDAHPLCKGVTWNPDKVMGYGNCYLKNDPTAGIAITPAAPFPYGVFVSHSAFTAPSAEEVTVTCPENSTWTASNDAEFDITCGDGRSARSNLTSVHESSIFPCIDTCAKFHDQACLGVVFDIAMTDGYNNCYLLNDTGSPNSGANATFAKLTGFARSGNSTSGEKNDHGGSKAWIAGPVIGALLALLLVGLGIWWWRRRSRRQEETSPPAYAHEKDGQSTGGVRQGVDGRANEQAHMLAAEPEPHELRDPKTEVLLRHEAPA